MNKGSSNLVAALENLANRIRSEYGLKSATQLVVGSQGWSGKSQVHGRFAPMSWTNAVGENVHEIMLSGESLRRGAAETAGTLIHELAHLYCHENQIKDTSDGGRWHNKRFKAVAENMGLSIEKADRIGFSVTTMPGETQKKYAEELDKITNALVTWRRDDVVLAASKPKPVKWMLECTGCNDPVPIGKKWAEKYEGNIMCREHDMTYNLISE